MPDADVVVVGVGVMGAAAGRALAAAGRDVLMLEQFEVGHLRGSSHGRARIFRLSYHDPGYVRMAQEALPAWRELEDQAGQRLLQTTGGIDTGKVLDDHVAALEACGASFEVLGEAEVGRRYPALRVGPDGRALFQPDAGVVDAERAWRAFVSGAARRGAQVKEGARVTALRATNGAVEVRTEEDVHTARVAVITAGGWARGVLAGVEIDLPTVPTRETVAYFRLDNGPVPTLVDWGTPAVYALPGGERGVVKAGEHRAGPRTDPDEEGSPSDESVARIAGWMRSRYPAADPEPFLIETCIYTNTAHEDFILERRGPVVVGSACSGHAFKFAPVVGERLAKLALATG